MEAAASKPHLSQVRSPSTSPVGDEEAACVCATARFVCATERFVCAKRKRRNFTRTFFFFFFGLAVVFVVVDPAAAACY